MAALAEFFDSLIGWAVLSGLALSVGGLVWAGVVLDPRRTERGMQQTVMRALRLAAKAAAAMAIAQILQLAAKAAVIAKQMETLAPDALIRTQYYELSLLRVAVTLVTAAALQRLAQRPQSAARWWTAAAAAAGLLVNTGWVSHAAGLLEGRLAQVAITTLHQTASSIWIGGVLHFVVLWHSRGRDSVALRLWPEALARFTPIGILCVAALAGSGTAMAFRFVGSWSGLIGTGYGTLLIGKWILLTAALVCALINLRAGKRWRASGGREDIGAYAPISVQTEAGLLAVILLVAASLASLPPAVDVGPLTARPSEVAQVFTPNAPRVVSPTYEEWKASRVELVRAIDADSPEEMEWSEYNHNIAGLSVIGLALLAFLHWTGRARWAQYWPLLFVPLGGFLLTRSDAEVWPLGNVGFFESMGSAEVLQHRLAIVVVFALGIVEWWSRTPRGAATRMAYVFPALVMTGGILLLTHSHGAFELKDAFLVQLSHEAIGLLAVFMAIGRGLELRLPGRAGRIAGLGSVLAMAMVGAVLTIYREPQLWSAFGVG